LSEPTLRPGNDASTPSWASARRRVVAVAGNPNVGKTTVFNQLTGMHQKVGNYPGVTVEWKTGVLHSADGSKIEILDVPGTYSLNTRSLDEEIAYRALIGDIEGTPTPDLIVCLADASNLERNLYFVSQVLDLGVPVIIGLNMVDSARTEGMEVDSEVLGRELGVPVIPLVASEGKGIAELKTAIGGDLPKPPPRRWDLQTDVENEVAVIADRIADRSPSLTPEQRFYEALRLITGQKTFRVGNHLPADLRNDVDAARARLKSRSATFEQAEILGRYGWIGPISSQAIRVIPGKPRRRSERIDAVLTHRIAGPAIFLILLGVIFQAVFSGAGPAMDAIDAGATVLGDWVTTTLPAGPLRDLLVDGVIAGVGAVVIFLPQILILFFFLGLLEDTGYMSRAAFLMDRLMNRVGLSGRSVVPLLSSFACAVPGIMAARTIENQQDRLVTILVAPLMTCSARLPVYALFIAAFVPQGKWLGFWSYQGMALFALYLLGILFAIVAGWFLRRFVVRGARSLFLLELPPYRLPRFRDLLWRLWERSRLFLVRAGTVIMAITIVLWFLASYPKPGAESTGMDDPSLALRASAIGQAGQFIEPALEPLGFNWKIGIALITSFAAREVAVSTLGTIYSIEDADEQSAGLRDRLRNDRDPRTGKRVFTPLVAASLLVFFVIAMQCISTLAIARRETNSWRWPLFMLGYMSVAAYLASLLVFQGGKLFGWG